jgi:undecaprenyl diphosphate synthase
MHVAIIMDGNRRWAKNKGLATIEGHLAGAENLGKLLESCPKLGIDTLTVYALSTENLIKRDKSELEYLFKIMVDFARKYKRKLLGENIRVKVLGRIKGLPAKLQDVLNDMVTSTKNGNKGLLQICLNYGGRQEIIDAVNSLNAKKQSVTEESLTKELNYPDVDLMIRPGGEQRISGFQLWQGSYAELYFSEKMWPEFDNFELEKAVEWFKNRNRRFGK